MVSGEDDTSSLTFQMSPMGKAKTGLPGARGLEQGLRLVGAD